jgi:hypothetical protein
MSMALVRDISTNRLLIINASEVISSESGAAGSLNATITSFLPSTAVFNLARNNFRHEDTIGMVAAGEKLTSSS